MITHKGLGQLHIFILVLFMFISVSGEIFRPRGVPISKVSLYDPSTDFTCFDGLRTIPFKYVNDDYCDCNDGTDEPGTAACPNGVFHCTNAGHKSMNIPTSRVNDGVCDCCDASDEYLTGNCSDVCFALGEVARQEAKQRAELIRQGSELRQQLIAKSKEIKQEKIARVQSLEKDRAEAEAVKKEKEMLKVEAEAAESVALEAYRLVEEAERAKQQEEEKAKEEQEAFEHFQLIDSNQDSKINIAEIQVRQTFDQNKDGVVSPDEIKFFMGDLEEADWDQFLAEVYPRMKPHLMMEKGLFKPPTDHKEDEETKEETTDQDHHEEWGEDDPEQKEEGEEEEDQHIPSEDDNEDDHKEDVEEQEEEETKPKYDSATQQLIDDADKTRADFDSAERAVRDVERELKHLQDSLAKDYGPEDEFLVLDGECFELTDREYTYKLCPFDQVSQKPRSGGAETRLGSWSNWVGRDNKYSAMLYENGQSCWNGPQRSTYVDVTCGLENMVTSATEPNRCEYRFHFTTPAACKLQDAQLNVPHDEL